MVVEIKIFNQIRLYNFKVQYLTVIVIVTYCDNCYYQFKYYKSE